MALGEGLVQTAMNGGVSLQLPGGGVVHLVNTPQQRIDPYVQALLEWVYIKPEAPEWPRWIAALKDHYLDAGALDPNAFIRWADQIPAEFTGGLPDRQSLGYVISAVVRYYSINNTCYWK